MEKNNKNTDNSSAKDDIKEENFEEIFFTAVKNKDAKTLNYLFDEKGFDINKYNPFNYIRDRVRENPAIYYDRIKNTTFGNSAYSEKTLLHYAVESGDRFLFDYLIKRKDVDLNKLINHSDDNALSMAVKLNETIKDKGSDYFSTNLYMIGQLYERCNYINRNSFSERIIKNKNLDPNLRKVAASDRFLRFTGCGLSKETESTIELCRECGQELDLNGIVSSKDLGIRDDIKKGGKKNGENFAYTPFLLALRAKSNKTAAIIYYHLNDKERKINEDYLKTNINEGLPNTMEGVYHELFFYCVEKNDQKQLNNLFDNDKVKFDITKESDRLINSLKNKNMSILAEIILRSENRRKSYEQFTPKLDETLKSELDNAIIRRSRNEKSKDNSINKNNNHKKPPIHIENDNIIKKMEDVYGKEFNRYVTLIPLEEDDKKPLSPAKEEILQKILDEKRPIKKEKINHKNKPKDINGSFYNGFGL